MSSRSIHIQQARHNEALVKELVSSGYRYKDWAVIAAFYAALHYFEARLHDEPPFSHPRLNGRVFHTADINSQAASQVRYSVHRWRSELLESNCARDTWQAYGNLRDASETAKYHSSGGIRSTAHNFFTQGEVDRLVSNCLETVKAGLGFN